MQGMGRQDRPVGSGEPIAGRYPAGLAIALIVLTALAALLRTWGLAGQIVIDDEWHAINKLMNASYAQVFASFGYSDHSVPMTLLYKAIAESVGLDEVNFRLPQVVAGILLVPVAGCLAWHASSRIPVAIWTATFVAAAPFLVFYSRYARPYAITTLLVVLALWQLWRWRTHRNLAVAVSTVALTAIAAWFHPLVAIFPATAFLYLLAEDAARARTDGFGPAMRTLALGVATAAAMAALLAIPIASDLASLSAKAGSHKPDAYTLWRMGSIFLGGLPEPVTAAGLALALVGAARLLRQHRTLGLYLVLLVAVPILVVLVARGMWTIFGHTFGRYVFPVEVILLFWVALGIDTVARVFADRHSVPGGAWLVAAVSAAYVASVPTIGLVARNPQWFGHMVHHLDYRAEHNLLEYYFASAPLPEFYRSLPDRGSESPAFIEAPFDFMAPTSLFAQYARSHGQPALEGFVHRLCLEGRYHGEVPADPRFRFRSFVDLADAQAVRATGARYLVFFTDRRWGEPFRESQRCLQALEGRYGKPTRRYATHVVFELRGP